MLDCFRSLPLAATWSLLALSHAPALPPWVGLSQQGQDYVLHPGVMHRDLSPMPIDSNSYHVQYAQPMDLLRQGFSEPALGGDQAKVMWQFVLTDGLIYHGQFAETQEHWGYAQDSSGLFLHTAASGLTQGLSFRLGEARPHHHHTVRAEIRLPVHNPGGSSSSGPGGQETGAPAAQLSWRLESNPGLKASLALSYARSPAALKAEVPGYRPLQALGMLSRRGLAGGLGYNHSTFAIEWQGALDHFEAAHQNEAEIAADFEGWLGRQGGAFTWHPSPAFEARLEGEGFMAAGKVVSYRGRAGHQNPFAYVPLDAFALRLATGFEYHGPWLTLGAGPQGTYARARLLQPNDPARRWLWNRNAILDAYQGSITGLFSRQTWLGTGEAEMLDLSGSAWAEKNLARGLQTQILLSLHHLEYAAAADLLKRDTELLITTRETPVELEKPRTTRWVLRPQITLSWPGRLGLQARVSQAIPLGSGQESSGNRHDTPPATGGNEDSGGTAAQWRGGLAWSVAATWSLDK